MTTEAVLNSTGILGIILIYIVIGRSKGTVKTTHKARLEYVDVRAYSSHVKNVL